MANAQPRPQLVQPEDQSIRLIALTKGQVTTVSAHRYEDLMRFNWAVIWSEQGQCFYAVRHGKKGEKSFIYMHRYIAGDPPYHTDHHDGNTLNNTDENIRAAEFWQNASNRGKQRNNTSGYKGVFKNGKKGWMAKLAHKGKQIYIGTYKTTADAARQYDIRAIELYGEFARTNFPRSDYEPKESPGL